MSMEKRKGGIFRRYFRRVRSFYEDWGRHENTRSAATVAFYTLFSLTPIAVVLVTIAGFVFEDRAAVQVVLDRVADTAGQQAAEVVGTVLEQARPTGGSLLAAGGSLALLLFGASRVFGELREALNRIWEARPRAQPWVAAFYSKLMAISVVLVIGALVVGSLVLSAMATGLAEWIEGNTRVSLPLLVGANLAVSFVLVTLLYVFLI